MKAVKLSAFGALLTAATLFARASFEGESRTVFASGVLVIAALATLSGGTWGVGLALLVGTAFGTANVLGTAPAWWWVVTFVSALPFALAWKPMAFFDRSAATLYAALAVGGGIACALIANLSP